MVIVADVVGPSLWLTATDSAKGIASGSIDSLLLFLFYLL
jgi:hypothetical protein